MPRSGGRDADANRQRSASPANDDLARRAPSALVTRSIKMLNIALLEQGLTDAFANPPASASGCGEAWANAVKAYCSAVVPPVLTPAIESAASALAGALGGAFSSPSAIGSMESAFAAFGAALALGMAPTFAGVPPAGPVGFASQFGGPAPTTHGAAASAIAGRIDSWMRTGSATLVAPPNTPIPAWS